MGIQFEWFTARRLHGIGCLICVFAMAFALFLQHVIELEPCPLCIFQRVAVIFVGCVFGLAWLINPGSLGQRVFSVLTLLGVGFGMLVAGRHIWIQRLPGDQVPSCGPGLDYMFDVLPLLDVLRTVFQGSGECAEESWRFLGLTIPEQTFLLFVVLGVIALVQLFRKRAER